MHITHNAPAGAQSQEAATATPASILSFWFDHKEPMGVWFGVSAMFDASIKEAFGASMAAAARGDLDHWQETPQGALALLILLDQFPRNVFRGDGRAFATDSKALGIALRAIARGFDREVPFIQQVFFYQMGRKARSFRAGI